MAAASMHDFVTTLNSLVETCKDGEQGYRKAAANVKRTDLQGLFNEYAQQRAQFASALQMEVSRIGGEPEKSGSASAAVHRGWMDLKGAVTGKDDHSILEEAERGEDVAVKAYRDALGKDLPTDLRSVVEHQYQAVEKSHQKIRSLRDNTTDVAGEYSGTTSSTLL